MKQTKYKPTGWRNEPHRHALAAKGISTKHNYFKTKLAFGSEEAVPTPDQKEESSKKAFSLDGDIGDVDRIEQKAKQRDKTLRTPKKQDIADIGGLKQTTSGASLKVRLKGKQDFEKAITEQVTGSRPVNQALEQVDRGQFAQAIQILNDPQTQEQDKEALQLALERMAVQQAQAGNRIPRSVLANIDSGVLDEITEISKAVERQRKRLTESPVKTALREAVPGVVGGTADAIGEGEKFLEDSFKEFQDQKADSFEQGLIGNTKKLGKSPLVSNNAFIGDKMQQKSTMKFIDEVPRLSTSFDFLDDDGRPPSNPVFMKDDETKHTFAEKINRQVNEIHSARANFAKVNLRPYDEGNKAFEQGDREGLIKSINKLKSEEAALKDRYSLVEEVRNSVRSTQNMGAQFNKKAGNFVFDTLGFGGHSLGQQTEKINQVRQEIVNANEQAFSRRQMLENRLRRMDSTVPPETDVPIQVQRFQKKDSFFNPLKIENPTL